VGVGAYGLDLYAGQYHTYDIIQSST